MTGLLVGSLGENRSREASSLCKELNMKTYSLPAQGCNVELTEIEMAGQAGRWWTLGFEAFGDLDTVPINLTLTLMPEKAVLERIVASGAFLSYPAWLLARRRE
jgi:hypothetical protein